MLQINDKSVKSKLTTIINQMLEASGLKEIQHIKKLKEPRTIIESEFVITDLES